jgi:hypothetical protein
VQERLRRDRQRRLPFANKRHDDWGSGVGSRLEYIRLHNELTVGVSALGTDICKQAGLIGKGLNFRYQFHFSFAPSTFWIGRVHR